MLALYKQEWQRFKQDYTRIFTWVLIVCISLLIIFYLGLVSNPDLTREMMDWFSDQIQRQVDMLGSELINHPLHLFWFILKNNLLVIGIIMVVGFIPIIVLPLFYSLTTIVSLATVLAVVQVAGESPLKILAITILPHGIVEITAMILSSSIGVYLSLRIFEKIFSKKRHEIRILAVIWQAVRSFLLVVVPLVIIAAFIEGFITPLIAKAFI